MDYNLQNEKVTTDNNGNVISSTSLAPTPTIQTVTPTPDTTNYSGITGGVTQSVMNDYATYNQQQKDAQARQDSNATSITDLMTKLAGKTADQQAANEISGVNSATADVNKYAQTLADLNAQASSLNREAQAIPIQVQQNAQGQGQTDRGIAPIEAGQLRLNAIKALSIGQQSDIAAAAAIGSQLRLNAAKDKAQQIIDLKYKPLEQELAIKQRQYDLNKDALDSIDKKRSEALQVSLNKEAQDLADKKSNEKAITDAVTQAGAQGAPADLVKAASEAKTPLEAAKILGKYNGDFLKYEMLKEQIKTEKAQQGKIAADTAKTYADIKKIKSDITSANPNIDPKQAGKYAGALSVILGSDKFTKEQKAAVTNAINNGQDPFAVIKNQAKNIMGQTEATALGKYEVIKAQQEDLQSLLSDYYANGGKTNIFKGNFEKTLNNLGEVSDPKLVELATNIAGSLQAYRNAISGTAYSAQEGKDIASIFPGINKSEGLNTAILKGRLNFIDKTIDEGYRKVLGSSYDSIKNSNVQTAAPVDNPFSKAIGLPQTPFLSTPSSLKGINPDGTLNFQLK